MTRKKGRTFRKRLRQHIRGDGGGGLRRKLSWVLYASPDPESAELDKFMREHFTARTLPMRVQRLRDEESISEAERRLIKEAEPCLNRKGLITPNVRRLQLLRAEAEAAGAPGAADEPTSGDLAELPEGDGEGQEPASSRPLSALGRFRRDFWAHCSRRHPGIAPAAWADSNVRHPAGATGRRFSLYVAQEGVGVFFPRERGESLAARAAAVQPTVDWLRTTTGDAGMPNNGWSFLEFDSRAKRNWDRMADWLHERRSLYERAPRDR